MATTPPTYRKVKRTFWIALAILTTSALPLALADDAQIEATVQNATPEVRDVVYHVDGEALAPGEKVPPSSGGDRTVVAHIQVKDGNGWNDVKTVHPSCTSPDPCDATFGTIAALEGSGEEGWWTVEILMPSDAPEGEYQFLFILEDYAGAKSAEDGDHAADNFEYETMISLSLQTTSVDFGAIAAGATSAAESLSVKNTGNVEIDFLVTATNLSHSTLSASIAAENLRARLAASDTPSGLGSDAVTLDANLAADGTGSFLLDLTVPDGSSQWVPAGVYQATATVTAAEST